MSPEAQRIKIAEACGWTDAPIIKHPLTGELYYGQSPVPDYLNDLNWMHEVEKVLTRDQWTHYIAELGGTNYSWRECCLRCAHATAAQRAEAFLRTLNRWSE